MEIKDKFDKNAFIQWQTPFGIIENSKKITNIKLGGKYYLKVVSLNKTYLDSTFVKLYPKPKLNLRDTVLCKGKAFYLDAKNSGLKYTWSTGETSQKIKVENTGNYWVKINNSGCISSATASIKFLPGSIANFNSETQFCLSDQNKVLSIKPTSGTKIVWNTGASSSSITITKEGTYWVTTENKNCGTQTDSVKVKLKACDCEMIIPNSFTPNEDNKNDYFFPVLQCEYSYFVMTISDKWGNTVFSTNNVNGKWDGRFKGNLCPEDNYVYQIESSEKGSDKKVVRKGHLSLFR
ncbi:MAG: gliding motility-associated C-terminal domain-containing protein [Bacteroidota bacterium]|nr:gliding motility-associated C-terminal domain-containing protein [Bacteroidota bacterium]